MLHEANVSLVEKEALNTYNTEKQYDQHEYNANSWNPQLHRIVDVIKVKS